MFVLTVLPPNANGFQTIANPIKKFGYKNEGYEAMSLLKDELLYKILLRRTKVERAADLALPPSAVRSIQGPQHCHLFVSQPTVDSCLFSEMSTP